MQQYHPTNGPRYMDPQSTPQYCVLDRHGWTHFMNQAPGAKGKLTKLINECGPTYYQRQQSKTFLPTELGKIAVFKYNVNSGRYDLIFEGTSQLGQAFAHEQISKDQMYQQINW